MDQEITIKGVKGGLLVKLPVISAQLQREVLIRRIQSQERFFKGGRMALDLQDATWTEKEVENLLRDLSDEGVCLWAILSSDPITLTAASAFGIPNTIGGQGAAHSAIQSVHLASSWTNLEIENGQTREFSSDQVLLGDLPSSAVLNAQKSLLVWGSVYGRINANIRKDTNAWLGILRNYSCSICFAGENVEITKAARSGACLRVANVDGKVQLHLEKAPRSLFS